MSSTIPHERFDLIPPPLSLHKKCIATGKTGIGGIKRPPSPSALERAAKIAKHSEVLSADEFRDRARKEYEDRRAEGKLRHARATCVNLDTKADVKVWMKPMRSKIPSETYSPSAQFNWFWLDSGNPESFPAGLLAALEESWSSSSELVPDSGPSGSVKPNQGGPDGGTAARLKARMQADALRPLNASPVGDEDEERPLPMRTGVDPGQEDHVETAVWPEETLLQVGDYLRLSVSHPLCLPTPH